MFAMRRTKLFGCLAAARAALSTLVLPSSQKSRRPPAALAPLSTS